MDRLQQKLAANKQVKKVYIQFGTDLNRLRSSLDWLTSTTSSILQQQQDREEIMICGSIFLPTKKLIQQQKFRPWNGVFLCEEFLKGEETATEIVLEMIKLYQSYTNRCEIIIEAPGVRNENDIQLVETLLQQARKDRRLRSSGGGGVLPSSPLPPQQQQQLPSDYNERDNRSPSRNDDHEQLNDAQQQQNEMKKRRVEQQQQQQEQQQERLLSPSPLLWSTAALEKPAILLFGSHDVRVHDNVAFQLASFHRAIIPVFIWCRHNNNHHHHHQNNNKWEGGGSVVGEAAQVALKDALKSLDHKLRNSGSGSGGGDGGLRLVCCSVDDDAGYQLELSRLCTETGATTIYWNKEHTTESRIREQQCKETLESIRNVQVIECLSSLLYDPTLVSLSGGFNNGGHWGTLMPFMKACQKQLGQPRRPILRHETFAILQGLQGPSSWPNSIPIDDLGLASITGKDRWDKPILERFPMNEEDALNTMNNFFARGGFHRYETSDRSRADIDTSTSKLSAHLRIGTLSPNELYYKIEDSGLEYNERKTFSRRLFWRELAYFQLLHFPTMREVSIRRHYDQTEWISGEEATKRFEAWKQGQTGYPLVDAGMRELWETGWMTQSIRMVVASFLTEYLRVNWVKGCEWFHYTLVDADSAINAMMWQNAGRSGIDQWNFVMSPTAASQDASGDYTRKWVPELSKLPKPFLHKPWEAPPEVLRQAGVVIGSTYPDRIVSDLVSERQKTVDCVLTMRHNNQEFNDNNGYDLIRLPTNGAKTVVFTKKEFRIDSSGNVIRDKGGKQKGIKKNKLSNSKDLRGRRGKKRTKSINAN